MGRVRTVGSGFDCDSNVLLAPKKVFVGSGKEMETPKGRYDRMTEHRSETLARIAEANGWEAVVVPDLKDFDKTGDIQDIWWALYAKRGGEALKVEWVGKRQTVAKYSINDEVFEKTQIQRILTTPPVRERSVPWTDKSPAFDIMMSVIGKTITWKRTLQQDEKTGYIPEENRKSKNFKVFLNHNNKRCLQWTGSKGFQTVLLDSIVDVSDD